MPDFLAIAQGRVDISQVKTKLEPVEASTNPMPAANATSRQAKQALISESQIAAGAAPFKQKNVSVPPTTKPEQKGPAATTAKTVLAKTGVRTAPTTVQREADEGSSCTTVSEITGRDSAAKVHNSEHVTATSGHNFGRLDTSKPTWSEVVTGRPSKPAKTFVTTADDTAAEVKRLLEMFRKIPPGAPGYTETMAKLLVARNELAKFAAAPGVGKDSFPELETPTTRLQMPNKTSTLDAIPGVLKPTIVVTPVDMDNS